MVDVRRVWFPRSVIPKDAVRPVVMDLLTSSDGSEKLAAACVHSRVLKEDGQYHTQLVASTNHMSSYTVP